MAETEPNVDKRGKKRVRSPEKWKKNVKSFKRNSGQEYTSSSDRQVPARVPPTEVK